MKPRPALRGSSRVAGVAAALPGSHGPDVGNLEVTAATSGDACVSRRRGRTRSQLAVLFWAPECAKLGTDTSAAGEGW